MSKQKHFLDDLSPEEYSAVMKCVISESADLAGEYDLEIRSAFRSMMIHITYITSSYKMAAEMATIIASFNGIESAKYVYNVLEGKDLKARDVEIISKCAEKIKTKRQKIKEGSLDRNLRELTI